MKNKLLIPDRFRNVNYEEDVPDFVKNYVDNFKKTRKGLYIFGSAGTGKTHLAYAICKKIEEEGVKVRAFKAVDILKMIKEDMNFEENGDYQSNGEIYFEKEDSFINAINDFKGLLFIDDLGAEKSTDWAVETLTSIIDKKYEDLIPIIITSNWGISELGEKTGDRIASRIYQMCEVVNMGENDRRLETQ